MRETAGVGSWLGRGRKRAMQRKEPEEDRMV